ncbi:MAG: phage tail tape measure protein, partial [Bacteroides oleiciplenus]|nr:phage tail tape measure protein [Bacteroides oleiciplenus]
GSLGNVIGGQAGAWMDWAGNLLGAIAQALPQLAALATANTAAAATGAASSVAGIPFAGPVMAVAAVASVLAALANLPKFANGGIAYGPTLGLFGEYAGASNNPEVVAPLDRLKRLIQPAGGTGWGKVDFVIEGRTLRGVLNKVDNFNNRTR